MTRSRPRCDLRLTLSSPPSSGATSTRIAGFGTVLDPMTSAAASKALVVATQVHYL